MAGSRRTVLIVAVTLCLALVAPTVSAAATTQAAQQENRRGRSQVQTDLLWLMAGLQQVDRQPKLKLSQKQAVQILAVLRPLVDHRLLALDPPSPRGASGQGAGAGQGGGGFQNLTPEQREQLKERRDAREAQLKSAMAAIDKILTPKQVEFIDNLDFDPSPYVFDLQGFGRNNGSGTPPTPAQIQQFRAKARETLSKAAALNRKTYELLEKRAGGK